MSRWTAALVLLVGACASASSPTVRWPLQPALQAYPFALTGTPVPLDASDPARMRAGALAYAGGLVLSAERGTSRFGGLSGMDVGPNGQLVAVTDSGDLVRFALRLDGSGRLVGVADADIRPLRNTDGGPLQGKEEADAEGLVVAPDGGLLVTFERTHRALAYADPAATPSPAPAPPAAGLPENAGWEGLAVLADGTRLFAAETGRLWSCRAARCDETRLEQDFGAEFQPTGLDGAPEGGAGAPAYATFRAFDPLRGMRAVVARLDPASDGRAWRATELARLAPPLTADNFESVVALPSPAVTGGVRLYVLSDDNFSDDQRTLLLAFDYAPGEARR